MDYKVKKEKSINRNYDFHLSIGLVLSLMIVISAFEWKSAESTIADYIFDIKEQPEKMLDIPVTSMELPQPPKPKLSTEMVEIPDDEDIEIKTEIEKVIETTPDIVELTKTIQSIPEPPIEPVDFYAFERHASPKKGMEGFNKYVSEAIAKNLNRKHRQKDEINAYVTFEILEDGSVGNFRIKGLDKTLSGVAIKAVKSYGNWTPARQQSHNVRENFNLPIKIKLK